LSVYNWAAANPDKVACIYADAPVCDFKSWPGGKGTGRGSAGSWQACLGVYGLTEQDALTYRGNPIDNLAPIAAARIPLLHVCGGADKVVPVVENTAIVEERYRKLGGPISCVGREHRRAQAGCVSIKRWGRPPRAGNKDLDDSLDVTNARKVALNTGTRE